MRKWSTNMENRWHDVMVALVHVHFGEVKTIVSRGSKYHIAK